MRGCKIYWKQFRKAWTIFEKSNRTKRCHGRAKCKLDPEAKWSRQTKIKTGKLQRPSELLKLYKNLH